MHVDLSSLEAPGPNGCPIFFFELYWNTIKSNLLKLHNNFDDGHGNMKCINWANIVFIAKVDTLDDITLYHPISFINSSLKIQDLGLRVENCYE